MSITSFSRGQEVYITKGPDTGRRGKITVVGTSAARVQLDTEFKSYSLDKLSFLPPNTIPLPPGYESAKHPRRGVGKEIEHRHVRMGDTIRTELVSEVDGFKQVSTKEGRVDQFTRPVSSLDFDDKTRYRFSTKVNGSFTLLNYQSPDETIYLISEGESPYARMLKQLKAGSVVEHLRDNVVATYVKNKDGFWHWISSETTSSSVMVTESGVVHALDQGAEIISKIR